MEIDRVKPVKDFGAICLQFSETDNNAKVGAGDTAAVTSNRYVGWTLTYPGRAPFESRVLPPQTQATMQAFHPQAVTITPNQPPMVRLATTAEAIELHWLIEKFALANDWTTTDLDEALHAALLDADNALQFFRSKT